MGPLLDLGSDDGGIRGWECCMPSRVAPSSTGSLRSMVDGDGGDPVVSTPLYDTIGDGYAGGRGTDPRWMATLDAALGDARSVINVGAGTGSYEPADRDVMAVEPSRVMISQRPPEAAPVVQATAEDLPFADGTFDWQRPEAYLDERVRGNTSTFRRLPADITSRAVARLETDLADGTWRRRHGHLLQETELDAGYRLMVSS